MLITPNLWDLFEPVGQVSSYALSTKSALYTKVECWDNLLNKQVGFCQVDEI